MEVREYSNTVNKIFQDAFRDWVRCLRFSGVYLSGAESETQSEHTALLIYY